MNKYIVVYSKSLWLLARLCTELQMEGCNIHNEYRHPWGHDFQEISLPTICNWLAIYSDNDISFYPHRCSPSDKRYTLTESNYIEVLKQILL